MDYYAPLGGHTYKKGSPPLPRSSPCQYTNFPKSLIKRFLDDTRLMGSAIYNIIIFPMVI